MADVLSAAEMLPWLEDEEADEVEGLISDWRRINRQAAELVARVPATAEKTVAERDAALAEIEKAIAKMARFNVHIRDNAQRPAERVQL